MNSIFSTTALAATAIATLSTLPAAANADMIWTAHQYPEGRIRFAVGDDLAGITTQHWLDLEGINVDRGVRVTLWADKDSGLQHLGLTWVDADGNGKRDCALDYAKELVKRNSKNFEQLVKDMNKYHYTIAAHVFDLLTQDGTSLDDPKLNAALKHKSHSVTGGLMAYKQSLAETAATT